jgi:hypothetical protein
MRREPGEAARAPVIVLAAMVILAVILGIATGSISEKTFRPPAPSPSDPITIP